MAKSNSVVNSIDKVVLSARQKYNEILQSEYVAKDILVDGQPTRGQVEENTRRTTTKEECTRTVTCMLDVDISRGSLLKFKESTEDDYSMQGICYSIPNKTPVDYYFQVLLFNTTANRHRSSLVYDDDGYVIEDIPQIIDEIPCFVQRIGTRERQVDAGIDRDSVNEIITTKSYDLKKDDVLYIGSDSYKITDIKELDGEIFHGYMTYYRI